MVSANRPDAGGLLSPAAQRVYVMLADGQAVDPVLHGPELGELTRWHLIARSPEAPSVPVVLPPQDAARRRMDAQMRQMAVQLEEMAAVPQIADMLTQEYERAQWRSGPGSQFLSEPEVVNARLDHVVAGAEREILAAQPGGPRTRELLERAVARDSAALARGVVKRTLYRDCVREDPVTAEGARIMSARGAGAEYRTMLSPFERCIVVDRREAFISDHVVEGSPPHAAWHVTDRAMVGLIAAVFDQAWKRATPWHGELRAVGGRQSQALRSVDDPRTSEIQREILRDMVSGITQASTAGRLGISVRTLQRELDQVREMSGAQSPAELGYWWALCPDRLADDRIDTISGPAEDAVA